MARLEKSIEIKSRLAVTRQGLKRGRSENLWLNVHRVSEWKDKEILETEREREAIASFSK